MFEVNWLGQAGYLLRIGETTICIDPYLSDIVFEVEKMARLVTPPFAPEALACDLLVATHDHMDHLDPASVPNMDRQAIRFAGPPSCIRHFQQLGIGSDNLVPLGRGETVTVGDVKLTGVFAEHTPDSIGLVVEAEGLRVYFTGDTLYSEVLGEGVDPDVVFCCINGKLGNMTSEQAVEVVEALRPRLAIPNHYGMFAKNTADPAQFLRDVRAAGIRTYEAHVGEPFDLAALLS